MLEVRQKDFILAHQKETGRQRGNPIQGRIRRDVTSSYLKGVGAVDEKQVALEFLQQKSVAWGPSVIQYILSSGVPGLTDEFAGEPDLSKLCGWFNKPADDIVVGVVEEFLQLEYPLFGEAVSILTQALLDACAQRHQINKQAAKTNITVGSLGVILLAALVATARKSDRT